MNKFFALLLVILIISGCSSMQVAPNYSSLRNNISSVSVAESMPYIVCNQVGRTLIDAKGIENAREYAGDSLNNILSKQFSVSTASGAVCLLNKEGKSDCYRLFGELIRKPTDITSIRAGDNLKQCLKGTDTPYVVLSCIDGFYRSTGNMVLMCSVSVVLIPLTLALGGGMVSTVIPNSSGTVAYTAVYDVINDRVIYFNKSSQHGSPLKKKEIYNAYTDALAGFVASPQRDGFGSDQKY